MSKAARGITPIQLAINRDSRQPLDAQIAAALRELILRGALAAGVRLPSSRTLAQDVQVSRNSVLAAYAQLIAEGYAEARTGSGTRVAAVTPERMLRAKPQKVTSSRVVPRPAAQITDFARTLTRFGSNVSQLNDRIVPFRIATPALDNFPINIWTRLLTRAALASTRRQLDAGDPAGEPRLRRAIAKHIYITRGVRCDAEQIVVTSSAQQAIDIAGRVLVDPGTQVWMEDPGYRGAQSILQALGAQLVPVPVDDDGIDVDAGRRKAPRARLAYLTPAHQYPLGVTMSLARRTEILAWARGADAYLIEDDYDSEFRFRERPIAALRSIDAERVIYIGTFSKSLFPGLRLAYLVLPTALVEPCLAVRWWSDGYSPVVTQHALAQFIEDAHFERHLRRMLVLYRERHDALCEAGARYLTKQLEIVPTAGGMHTVGWLREGHDDVVVARRAAAAGIDVLPVSAFSSRRLRRAGLVLGFAAFSPREIRQAAQALAAVLTTSRS